MLRLSTPDLVKWYVKNGITCSLTATPIGAALIDEVWPPEAKLRLLTVGGK